MKSSEILIKSLDYLCPDGHCLSVNNKTAYICYSINKATSDLKSILQLKKLIEERLEGYTSLSCWLFAKGVPESEIYSGDGFTERMQEHRKQWVLMLIKEYQDKGD